jgi:hypothetical protein
MGTGSTTADHEWDEAGKVDLRDGGKSDAWEADKACSATKDGGRLGLQQRARGCGVEIVDRLSPVTEVCTKGVEATGSFERRECWRCP